MEKLISKITLICLAQWLLATHAVAADCELKLGAVPQFDQRKLFSIWSPIAEGLSSELGCKVTIVGSKNISAFEENFKKGVYDIAYMNPYHAIMAHQSQGYLPQVRSGAKLLKGILVVKKDMNFKDLSQFKDQPLAFPSPNALGASLLMRAELAEKHGVPVDPKYVKTHNSVYLHVAKGLTTAGGGVMRTLKQQPKPIQDLLKVIYTTTPVPAHPIVVHPRVGTETMEKIQKALLKIAERSPDQFHRIPMKAPIETNIEDYQLLKKMHLEKYQGK